MNELYGLGTIVTIKGINKPIMIMGYLQKVDGQIYDYLGVPYPSGLVSKKSAIAFNHNTLETLISEGYKDEEGEVFLKALPRLVAGAAALKESNGEE